MIRKLLVTGASGFLGYTLCAVAQSQWKVYGTINKHVTPITNCTLLSVDLTDTVQSNRVFTSIGPDVVIHTAAMAHPNICQDNPEVTRRINVDVALHLATLCKQASIPYLFISSDLVFDGTQPPYTENDAPSPLSHYGQQKVDAENAILDCYQRATVVRMPLMFGDPSPFSGSCLFPIVSALKNGIPITLFYDEFRAPLSALSAVTGLFLCIEKQFSGILHLSGLERMSRYDFGLAVAACTHRDSSCLLPTAQASVPMSAPRPHDVTMDYSLAKSLGFQPLSVNDELLRLKIIQDLQKKHGN